MKISYGKNVFIHFKASSGQDILETTEGKSPLQYVQGRNNILPQIQRHLEGLTAGDRCEFILKPEDAYGEIDEGAFVELPKTEMPNEKLHVGMVLQEKQKDGSIKIGRIAEIREETVLMDFNHPMAGKTVKYEINVVDVK